MKLVELISIHCFKSLHTDVHRFWSGLDINDLVVLYLHENFKLQKFIIIGHAAAQGMAVKWTAVAEEQMLNLEEDLVAAVGQGLPEAAVEEVDVEAPDVSLVVPLVSWDVAEAGVDL